MQQANGNVADFQPLQPAQQFAGGLLLQRQADPTRVQHAFRNFKAALPRNQGLGTLLEVVIEPGAVLPHDVGHVPESGGDQQGHLGSLALQNGVGGHGGPVNEEPHRLGGNPELAQDPAGPLDDGRAGVIGGAGDLQEPEDLPLLVKTNDVGKGTPDVDSDSDGHGSPMSQEWGRPKRAVRGRPGRSALTWSEAPYCKLEGQRTPID